MSANFVCVHDTQANQLISKENLDAFLSVDIPDYAGFMKAMQEAGGVISGSILLQAIYDKRWENSDIDVFIKGNAPYIFDNPLTEYLLANGYVLVFSPSVEDIYAFENKQQPYSKLLSTYGALGFVSAKYAYLTPEQRELMKQEITKFGADNGRYLAISKIDDSTISFVVTNNKYDRVTIPLKMKLAHPIVNLTLINNEFDNPSNKSIVSIIYERFDIDICKIAYDGNNLYIYRLEDIISKKTKVDLDVWKKNFIQAPVSTLELVRHPTDFINNRVKKYKARGIKISYKQ